MWWQQRSPLAPCRKQRINDANLAAEVRHTGEGIRVVTEGDVASTRALQRVTIEQAYSRARMPAGATAWIVW
jgi:hypothetical protein